MRLIEHFIRPHMPIGATGALHASTTGAATPSRYLAILRNHHLSAARASFTSSACESV
jgi:hypothetical protein